ncbi:MAG: N-acetylmuramoyl-L-alanine amidase [Gemmatimonadaceae bacterium]
MEIRVVYPPAGATIAARDSTFLFGSLGNGDATLTINGAPVRVLPNGSWLAWLPLPPRERPQYEIVAVRGSDTVRTTHRIAYPATRPSLPESGPLVVDSASLSPRGSYSRLANELVRVSIRAPVNSSVEFRWSRDSLRPFANASLLGTGGDANLFATELPVSLLDSPGARVIVRRGSDSVSLGAPRVARADSGGRHFAFVGTPIASSPTSGDSTRVIIGKPVAGGTYKWFLIPGTIAEVTGRSGEQARIRLDRALDVWVDGAEIRDLPLGFVPPVRVAGNARVVARGEWSDLIIPMAERPAWSVDEGENALDLTLYQTTANTDIINYSTSDSIIRRVSWTQEGEGRARYHIALHQAPYGYLVRWERGAFVLRVRRPPHVNADRPLAGLTIAIDAGHPPAGSTGPTGLYEGVATLAIANRLKPMLESRGATVIMTRTTAGPVGLGDRQPIAIAANAHAFVSIHLNALPDGVNPFVTNGTGAYYFNPSSEPLARQVQRGMVRTMGLRDLGVNYDNLAVLRPSWMPSILCEGAFVMFPEQEALLRMPEFQSAYATGVAEGVEAYFRSLASVR